MPTATRSSTEPGSGPGPAAPSPRRRALAILVGHNLPLALWLAYAGYRLLVPDGPRWTCPLGAWLGFCPGCGMTSALRGVLQGRLADGWWILVLLALFLATAVASLRKARRA